MSNRYAMLVIFGILMIAHPEFSRADIIFSISQDAIAQTTTSSGAASNPTGTVVSSGGGGSSSALGRITLHDGSYAPNCTFNSTYARFVGIASADWSFGPQGGTAVGQVFLGGNFALTTAQTVYLGGHLSGTEGYSNPYLQIQNVFQKSSASLLNEKLDLPAGTYLISGHAGAGVQAAGGAAGGANSIYDFWLTTEKPGSTPDNPVITPPGDSNVWYDPPVAYGYNYTMKGASLFTKIEGFAPGFDPVTISVGGVPIGTFSSGQIADFSSFPGGGVSSFSVTDIHPSPDADDPAGFPIKLDFNTTQADFSYTPIIVPEPNALTLFLATLAVSRRTRGRICWLAGRRLSW